MKEFHVEGQESSLLPEGNWEMVWNSSLLCSTIFP